MSITPRQAYWLLLLGSLAVFGQVLWFDFVEWDDPAYVSRNPAVQAGLSWDGIRWAFDTRFYGLWHPLAWLSHMGDASLWGSWAGGHHLTSVAIHALAAALFLAFLHESGVPLSRAFVAAALFAVHPLRVESVAWVAERKDVLCVAMLMLCLWAHGRWVRTGKNGFGVLAHAACALALLAKPLAVVAPILLLLADWWPLRRSLDWRRLLLEKAGYAAMAALMVALLFDPSWLDSGGSGRDRFDLATRLSLAAHSAWMLTLKFVWPVELSFFHPIAWDSVRADGLRGAAFLAVLLALALAQHRRRPWLSMGIAWYLAALLPSSGLVQISDYAYADRYAYLPSAGQCLIVAMLLPRLPAEGFRRRAALGLAGAAAGLLLALTVWQTSHWRDSEALFRRAIEIDPANHFAQLKLSDHYVQQGDLAKAEHHGRLAVDPAAGIGYQLQLGRHLGQIAFKRGDFATARRYWTEGLDLNPRDPFLHYHLGQLTLATGAPEAAVGHLAVAIETLHASGAVWEHLGLALERSGRLADARAAYLRAVEAPGASDEAARALARLSAPAGASGAVSE